MAQNPFELYARHPASRHRSRKAAAPVIDTVFQEEAVTEKLGLAGYHIPVHTCRTVVLFFFALIIFRFFSLQIVQGSQYQSIAEGNRTHLRVLPALRGVLYDRNGTQLVKNIPNFTLAVSARQIPRLSTDTRAAYLTNMRSIAGVDEAVFTEAYQRSLNTGQPVSLREHIPYQEALQLMIATHAHPGLLVESRHSREYASSPSYSHVLGYTGRITQEEYARLKNSSYLLNDELGKTGLEKQYESTLRGINGTEELEVDYRGREVSLVSKTAPISGNHLYTSIDARLQELLSAQLQKMVDERGVPGGAIVAIDPRTGKIRALVSYPSFSSNAFAQGISTEHYQQLASDEQHPLFHRAISGEYPAGSAFKPIVAAAGLEEGIITEQTTVNSTGGIRINEYFFPDFRPGGYGVVTVITALARSVNTFFYIVGGGENESGGGLGIERMMAYAQKFGLGATTGIDLPDEADGFLPSKAWKEEYKNERWYIGDTYHAAIGQGDVLTTPLQIAVATATIANGGTLYEPQVVERIVNQSGEIVRIVEPVVRTSPVVSQKSIEIVRRGMREAVLSGGGRSLQTLSITAAGKTGTAQFGTEEKTHAWFTMFAPYENPELVITVLIEEGGIGEEAAVPVAREALREYLAQ